MVFGGEERRRASERGSGVKARSNGDDPVKTDVLKGPRRARRYNAFSFLSENILLNGKAEEGRRGKAGDFIIRPFERSDGPFLSRMEVTTG